MALHPTKPANRGGRIQPTLPPPEGSPTEGTQVEGDVVGEVGCATGGPVEIPSTPPTMDRNPGGSLDMALEGAPAGSPRAGPLVVGGWAFDAPRGGFEEEDWMAELT